MNTALGEPIQPEGGRTMLLKCTETDETFRRLCDELAEGEPDPARRSLIYYFKSSIQVSNTVSESRIYWRTPFLNYTADANAAIRKIGIEAWRILLDIGYDPTVFQEKYYATTQGKYRRGDDGIPPSLGTVLNIWKIKSRENPLPWREGMGDPSDTRVNNIPRPTEEEAIQIFEMIFAKFPTPTNINSVHETLYDAIRIGFFNLAKRLIQYGGDVNQMDTKLGMSVFEMIRGPHSKEYIPQIEFILDAGGRMETIANMTLRRILYYRFQETPSRLSIFDQYFYLVHLGGDPNTLMSPERYGDEPPVPCSEALIAIYPEQGLEVIIRVIIHLGILVDFSKMAPHVQEWIHDAVIQTILLYGTFMDFSRAPPCVKRSIQCVYLEYYRQQTCIPAEAIVFNVIPFLF